MLASCWIKPWVRFDLLAGTALRYRDYRMGPSWSRAFVSGVRLFHA